MEIKIANNVIVLIDEEDFDLINKYKWYSGARGYATTDLRIRKRDCGVIGQQLLMHNLIMHIPEGKEVDHIDRNKLNNQKINLRITTHQGNTMNKPGIKNRSSQYKGVIKTKSGKYEVQIKLNYKSNSIGRLTDEIVAAKIYDAVVRFYFPEIGYTNFDEATYKSLSVDDARKLVKDINLKNKENE